MVAENGVVDKELETVVGARRRRGTRRRGADAANLGTIRRVVEVEQYWQKVFKMGL
jgi:hypothetical protein